MRVVALVSGGKDSLLAALYAVRLGHTIACLANLYPEPIARTAPQELDSYCFQTVGHQGVEAIAECAQLPLRRRSIRANTSRVQTLSYDEVRGAAASDEVEELFALLRDVQAEFGVEGVVSGAILSGYQRLRVENVSRRLGLVSLAPLWQRAQSSILDLIDAAAIDAKIIKVASYGLRFEHLGRSTRQLHGYLLQLADFGVNCAGEGGEFESFVCDCPLFQHKRIEMVNPQVVVVDPSPIAPSGHLVFDVHVVPKTQHETADAAAALQQIGSILPLSAGASRCQFTVEATEMSSVVEEEIPKGDEERVVDDVNGLRSPIIALWNLRAKNGFEEGPNTAAANPSTRVEAQVWDLLRHHIQGDKIDSVCLIVMYVPTMDYFAAVNAAYSKFFEGHLPCCRAVVELPRLTEVVMDVYLRCGDSQPTEEKKVLQVQSRSSWAAAVIGPYAQAVRASASLLFLSGCIGIVPETLQLPSVSSSEIERYCAELSCAADNMTAVLSAMGVRVADLTHVVVFVTSMRLCKLVVHLWQRFTGAALPPHHKFVLVDALPKHCSVELLPMDWRVSEPCPVFSRNYHNIN